MSICLFGAVLLKFQNVRWTAADSSTDESPNAARPLVSYREHGQCMSASAARLLAVQIIKACQLRQAEIPEQVWHVVALQQAGNALHTQLCFCWGPDSAHGLTCKAALWPGQ